MLASDWSAAWLLLSRLHFGPGVQQSSRAECKKDLALDRNIYLQTISCSETCNRTSCSRSLWYWSPEFFIDPMFNNNIITHINHVKHPPAFTPPRSVVCIGFASRRPTVQGSTPASRSDPCEEETNRETVGWFGGVSCSYGY